jgi:phosphatidylinositol glycan class Z
MLVSAVSGVALLSIFPHQEARFLLPAVPLILSSIRLPSPRFRKAWIVTWIVFNLGMGMLMGVYHQGGIVPAQMHIAKTNEVVSNAFWWKTYSPPIWLLNGKNENLTTIDLMGMPREEMLEKVKEVLPPCRTRASPKLDRPATYLITPRSANVQRSYMDNSTNDEITMYEVWSHRKHLNLDDMDFESDGIWKTLGRVVGDRGIVIWRVSKNCWSSNS